MRNVLLLNASYEPLCAISAKRAIVLVLSDKAEVVTERSGSAVHSASLSFPMPSVVRLIRYVNVPRFRKAYLSRRTILARDNKICCYCGGKANTMDHVIPRSREGRHTWTNIVACCYDCNQRKDNRLLEDLGWKMLYVPFEPEGTRRIVLILGSIDPDWEEWLQEA